MAVQENISGFDDAVFSGFDNAEFDSILLQGV